MRRVAIADADEEDRAIAPCQLHLALLRRQARVFRCGILGMHEHDILGKGILKDRIVFAKQEGRPLYGGIDRPDGILEVRKVPILRQHHLLPVPLVDVDRMDLIDIVIGAERIHISIYTPADGNAVVCERHPLPLRKRLDDLHALGIKVAHAEPDRVLHSVKVIIDARDLWNEDGRCHPGKPQCP